MAYIWSISIGKKAVLVYEAFKELRENKKKEILLSYSAFKNPRKKKKDWYPLQHLRIPEKRIQHLTISEKQKDSVIMLLYT